MSGADKEFSVDGHAYTVSRISTFDQLNIASEWREMLMGLALAKKSREKEARDGSPIPDRAFAEGTLLVVLGALSRVEASSRENLTKLILSKVKRKGAGKGQGVGWFPVTSATGEMQFQDVGVPQIAHILYHAFDHNGMLDFFSVSPSDTDGRETEETGPISHEVRTG